MTQPLVRAVLAFLAFGAAASLASAAEAPVLTLTQAVEEALVHNDRLVNQHDAIAQADLGVRLARNVFQPKVTPNILGSFGQTNVSSQTYRVDLSQRFTTGTELRLGVGTASAQIPGQGSADGDLRFYNADTTLTLTQPLLRGFGPSVARRALTSAEFRRADSGRMQALVEQQVAVDVATAYYRAVAQQASTNVARHSVERARRLREASEAKLDAGLVSQLDVLRAQQLVAQAEMQLFDAQSATEDARDQLAFLLGRDRAGAFDVQADIPDPDQAPIDPDTATAIARRHRLDLRSQMQHAADADRQIRFARNQLLPQVDVNLALTRRETATGFLQSFAATGFQFATFFTIAMPVDRTAPQVEYQSALIDRDRRHRDLATYERRIDGEVRRALRERDRSLRALIAADTRVSISRREVEVAQLRYERGLSNNLDVVAAETGLLGAETQRIQALADSAVQRLHLRALMGVLDPRRDLTGTSILPAAGPETAAEAGHLRAWPKP